MVDFFLAAFNTILAMNDLMKDICRVSRYIAIGLS